MAADPRALHWWLSQMRHSRGRWAGKPFDPRPWQSQFIADMFALRPDGRRRYREGLLGVARKSGKTTLTAGLALGLQVLEAEPGGQIVCAAAKKDQAKLLLKEATNMVAGSSIGGRRLSDFLVVRREGIHYPELDTWLKVVTADADMEQGLNPNVVIIDELHVVKQDLYEVLRTAQGAWEDPLLLSITTAGARKAGVCWDKYRAGSSAEMLMRWFEADEKLDIDDPRAWEQANPGYPEVPNERYLRGQLPPAIGEGAFMRYHLNRWTQLMERWLPAEDWNATARPPDIPEGCEVIVVIDAAQTNDTFAVTLMRKDEQGNPHALLKVFTAEKGKRIHEPDVEDYILAKAARHRVAKLVGDPAKVTLLAQRLAEHGLDWEPFHQHDRMLIASELLQKVVMDRTLRRGDDPVWDEQMSGTAVRETDRGVRISKAKSGGKNDAIITLAMGLGVLYGESEPEREHYFAVLGG